MNISAATQLALKLSANIDLDHQIISDVDQLSFTTDKDVAYDLVKSRLLEGKGEVLLDIGVNNEGESLCLDQLKFQNYLNLLTLTADQLNADLSVVYKRSCVKFGSSSNVSNSDGFYYAHCLIRQRCNGKVEDIIEARVAVVGNVDAGKSTLLGVLTKDLLDDGRGKARVNLFTHKHELETGRTSSVGTEIMGFDSKGTIITPRLLNKSKINWEDVCYASSKVISFIDLAGHEKYLRTTAFGMTGHAPDYAILMIGANSGVIGMTREHLGLALALNVPVMIVITKIDMCISL